MPLLSVFYGISIFMYWDDHNPPHYHARYGEHEARIAIGDQSVMNGFLPPRALRLVHTWHSLHQTELEAAWGRAEANLNLGTIDPLP